MVETHVTVTCMHRSTCAYPWGLFLGAWFFIMFGFLRAYSDLCGCLRICARAFGFVWVCSDLCRGVRICAGVFGFVRVCSDFPKVFGFPRVCLDFPEFVRVSRVCSEIWKNYAPKNKHPKRFGAAAALSSKGVGLRKKHAGKYFATCDLRNPAGCPPRVSYG